MLNWLNRIPLSLLLVACLTLGLAPFVPEPHVWQKMHMLTNGELHRPVDIFDLCLHAAPWILLLARLLSLGFTSRKPD